MTAPTNSPILPKGEKLRVGEPLMIAIQGFVRECRLTPSERELLELACTGGLASQREMAAVLGIGLSTISRQRQDLLRKTGDARLSHVVVRVLRQAYHAAVSDSDFERCGTCGAAITAAGQRPSSRPCPIGGALDAAGCKKG